ncbi:hypothetical protein ACTMTF_15175 [Nonomuraea sp. ZG12]|uniref:hypothetical protein n=1 Tax=Nonomuraea sp. ZG12 TaxID=3452207 RepID=UPI003F8B6FF8
MDTAEFAASFQALLDQQRPQDLKPQPSQDVLLVSEPLPEPELDPFFEHYFVPETTHTSDLPAYPLAPEDPYGVFDDHLLEETEETKDVAVTNPANAAYRAKRTGFQGALVSVLVAVGGVLASLTIGAEIDWRLLGLSVGQAVLTAVISYLHNDKSATSE